MTDQQHEEWMGLAEELGMSPGLACDMYILAGMDADIVRKCSSRSNRLDTMKCRIINERFNKLEEFQDRIEERMAIMFESLDSEAAEEKGREDGCEEERQGSTT